MKTKTSNVRQSVEVAGVTALGATVNEVDKHLYVSRNSECHFKLCSCSQNLGPFITLPNSKCRNTRVII